MGINVLNQRIVQHYTITVEFLLIYLVVIIQVMNLNFLPLNYRFIFPMIHVTYLPNVNEIHSPERVLRKSKQFNFN